MWKEEKITTVVIKFHDNDYYSRFYKVKKIIELFLNEHKAPLDKFRENDLNKDSPLYEYYKKEFFTKDKFHRLIWKSFELVNENIYGNENIYVPFEIVENGDYETFMEENDSDMMFIDFRNKNIFM